MTEGRELTLRVAFIDGVGLHPHVAASIRPLVEEIFAQVQVRIAWVEPESLFNGSHSDGSYHLNVILWSREPAVLGLPENVMGAVIGKQFPADVVYLFNPVIQRSLRSLRTRSRGMPTPPAMVAQAYAKVFSHEVIHAIAPTQPHAEFGLMDKSQHTGTLVNQSVDLDEESAAAFRNGLARLQQPVASQGG